MPRYCESCGKELQGDMPCPLCNPKPSGAVPVHEESNRNAVPYPTRERVRPGMVVEIVSALFFCAIMIHQVINDFQMYVKWGDDLFGLILSCVLLIFCFLAVIIGFLLRKERVYLITCPACGQQIVYPVGAEGINCSCCQKRLVMSGNEIKKID